MSAAGFTGGEAEELRRAMGFKRSEARMREIEVRLRAGMERNGITGATQDRIVQHITAFALYGFPESHAASFALIAYASAYLKCHYLAAFTAALLNNQPMGFYHPSTIIKDAQRHGLRVLPIDVTKSDWRCTVERGPGAGPRGHPRGPGFELRLGLNYVKGLRGQVARAIVETRARKPFTDIDDLARRVPALRKDEIRRLAGIGALNSLGPGGTPGHRRDALWQAERAGRPSGPLLEELPEPDRASPLAPMTPGERLVADYRGSELTIGRHPMAYRRAELDRLGAVRAADLARIPNGRQVRVAGCVIVRQRPGTAKGFLFLSLEDETGISNIIATPDFFEANRRALVEEPFLLIEGQLQNLDNAISIKARRLEPLLAAPAAASHDFH
jgi:error-prone DNA polymerase